MNKIENFGAFAMDLYICLEKHKIA